MYVWTGSVWTVMATSGDISAVYVTSPLTGGGASGDVTVAIQAGTTSQSGAVSLTDSTASTSITTAATPNSVKTAYDLAAAAVPKSTVTTAGDLIVANGNASVTRLGIGTSGYILTSNGTTATWGAAPAGYIAPTIGTTTITSATTVSTITSLTLNNGTLTGTLTASSSSGVNGQFLQSTGSGVAWGNPATMISAGSGFSSGGTITTSENGKYVLAGGGITLATTSFTEGMNCVIYNNTASGITITQGSGVTLRFTGAGTTGNRTLSAYGLATVLCISSNNYIISGTGLS